eukprot:364368-Chlamydomonas_euryale.AAC.6
MVLHCVVRRTFSCRNTQLQLARRPTADGRQHLGSMASALPHFQYLHTFPPHYTIPANMNPEHTAATVTIFTAAGCGPLASALHTFTLSSLHVHSPAPAGPYLGRTDGGALASTLSDMCTLPHHCTRGGAHRAKCGRIHTFQCVYQCRNVHVLLGSTPAGVEHVRSNIVVHCPWRGLAAGAHTHLWQLRHLAVVVPHGVDPHRVDMISVCVQMSVCKPLTLCHPTLLAACLWEHCMRMRA